MVSGDAGTAARRAVHVRVRGRVQGVGFRYYVVRSAVRLGLVGYTRNLADGSVEIWAEGASEDLDSLVLAARQGPRSARVDDLDVHHAAPKGSFRGFDVRY